MERPLTGKQVGNYDYGTVPERYRNKMEMKRGYKATSAAGLRWEA
jgi:hypothetical protein